MVHRNDPRFGDANRRCSFVNSSSPVALFLGREMISASTSSDAMRFRGSCGYEDSSRERGCRALFDEFPQLGVPMA